MTKEYDVLVYGAWIDPRSCGISSVQHDVIKEVAKRGKRQYLITEDWDNPNPRAVQFTVIEPTDDFQWQDVVGRAQIFDSLDDLLEKDARGEVYGGESALQGVGVIHSHTDDIIPHYNPDERHVNNYRTLASGIQQLSGRKPKLVRTRHDEVHAAIDRLNRLCGFEWDLLSDEVREDLLEDGTKIIPYVNENIADNRDILLGEYRWDEQYLEDVMDHVYYILHKLRLWRSEPSEFDAIVNLTYNGAEASKRLCEVNAADYHKFTHIHNGTSFEPTDWGRVHGNLEQFHINKGLHCYRGDSIYKEGIEFDKEDKKVIFVGRTAVDKGALELAESLKQLYHSGHQNVKGIFVGNFDEEDRRKLVEIDPENAENYLLFTGRVENINDLASIYWFGDLTAIPSHYDTFNLVGAESLRMGTPIVATNFSGLGDAYFSSPESSLVEVGLPVQKKYREGPGKYFGVSVDSLTEQIEKLITDPELASKLGVTGEIYSKEHLSSERMGREYADLFDRLMQIEEEESDARHISFVCNTLENTHGVPIVMKNIADYLKKNTNLEVSFIGNHFDNNVITYVDADDREWKFRDREEFTTWLNDNDVKIDVLHSHTWHLSDYYLPFHSDRDEMDLPTFLEELGRPKLIYTDHANPTFDLDRISELHGLHYLGLSQEEKERFLRDNLLDYHDLQQWQMGWEATSILSKRQMMQLADEITYVSATQRNEEKNMIPGINFESKEKVIMNGIDLGKYVDESLYRDANKLRQRMQLHDLDVILYAGRMDEEKGIYDLAEAVNIMNKDSPVALIYLGDSTDVQNEILRTTPSAIFPGRIEDRRELAAFYAMADVVAQPTWGECFNQVMAEALMVGTPGVVSDYSATGEIYVRNGAALGCHRNNPEDLADKLDLILSDEALYERYRKNGKEFVERNLTQDIMCKKYLELYS